MAEEELAGIPYVRGCGLPERYGTVAGGILRNVVVGVVGGVALGAGGAAARRAAAGKRRGPRLSWRDAAAAGAGGGNYAGPVATPDEVVANGLVAVKFIPNKQEMRRLEAEESRSGSMEGEGSAAGAAGTAAAGTAASGGNGGGGGGGGGEEGADAHAQFTSLKAQERMSEGANIKALLAAAPGGKKDKLAENLRAAVTLRWAFEGSPSAGCAPGAQPAHHRTGAPSLLSVGVAGAPRAPPPREAHPHEVSAAAVGGFVPVPEAQRLAINLSTAYRVVYANSDLAPPAPSLTSLLPSLFPEAPPLRFARELPRWLAEELRAREEAQQKEAQREREKEGRQLIEARGAAAAPSLDNRAAMIAALKSKGGNLSLEEKAKLFELLNGVGPGAAPLPPPQQPAAAPGPGLSGGGGGGSLLSNILGGLRRPAAPPPAAPAPFLPPPKPILPVPGGSGGGALPPQFAPPQVQQMLLSQQMQAQMLSQQMGLSQQMQAQMQAQQMGAAQQVPAASYAPFSGGGTPTFGGGGGGSGGGGGGGQRRRGNCLFFVSRMGCKNGDSCAYYHDPNYQPPQSEFDKISGAPRGPGGINPLPPPPPAGGPPPGWR